jgi:hypothetical protein
MAVRAEAGVEEKAGAEAEAEEEVVVAAEEVLDPSRDPERTGTPALRSW